VSRRENDHCQDHPQPHPPATEDRSLHKLQIAGPLAAASWAVTGMYLALGVELTAGCSAPATARPHR
jgi:hypothetical protein